MCTSIAHFGSAAYFGRTLDLPTPFGQQVIVTPRRFRFSFHLRPPLESHFAMIGMAAGSSEYPLYAEAMNEKGLYMAGLNFPGNAFYPEAPFAPDAVTPYELIPLVLGSCETLAQARQLLQTLPLAAIPFAPGYPLAPLHWQVADRTGAFVMEHTRDGIHLYDDPVGVLTNNPPFPFQMANLANYQHLSCQPVENRLAPNVPLDVCGQGMGAIGLPGDVSPMSRFVRAAFLNQNSLWGETEEENVTQFFHILDGVSMVKGSVITSEGEPDLTLYACCCSAQTQSYYYKTYSNSQICGICMADTDLDGEKLAIYPLATAQQICWQSNPPKNFSKNH